MLSRNAQGLYWIGRYLERAQHGCRLLTDQLETLKDRSVEEIELSWRRLYGALSRVPLGGELGSNLGDDWFMLANAYTLADDLTFEPDNPDAIRSLSGHCIRERPPGAQHHQQGLVDLPQPPVSRHA